jgi:heme A synthase
VLVGLTSLGVLVQAVTAGLFVNQDGRDSWVDVHGVVADVTWVLALVTAAYAFHRLRRTHRTLFVGATALFVLALAQTGLGHLITDKGMDGLIVVHVPVAVLLFGLATWLSVATSRLRRQAPDPYGPDPHGADPHGTEGAAMPSRARAH